MAEVNRHGSGTGDTANVTGSNAAATQTRSPRWNDYSDRYREDWTGRYGEQRPWSNNEDNYRFGWEAGMDDRYKARDYGDVEADLRKAWSNGSGTNDADRKETNPVARGWEEVKETVREGFERARMEFDKRF